MQIFMSTIEVQQELDKAISAGDFDRIMELKELLADMRSQQRSFEKIRNCM